MAKVFGLGGYLSGKMGSVVYMRGTKGTSYARTYNANPGNPKSVAQLTQRAKMNLVGRISQIAPKALLLPIGLGTRANRNYFNRALLDAAAVTEVEGLYTASIAPDALQFSKGAEVIAASANQATVTADDVTIQLTLLDATLAGKYGERVIVVTIDPKNVGGISTIRWQDVVLENTTATTIEIRMPEQIVDGTMVVIYRAPFVLSAEGMAVKTSGLYNNTTALVAGLLASSNGMFRGWGDSLVQQTSVFTQA